MIAITNKHFPLSGFIIIFMITDSTNFEHFSKPPIALELSQFYKLFVKFQMFTMMAKIKSRLVWCIIFLSFTLFLVYRGNMGPSDRINDRQGLESYRIHQFRGRVTEKNYETYNNERKEQVFASNSKFQVKRLRYQVTDGK